MNLLRLYCIHITYRNDKFNVGFVFFGLQCIGVLLNHVIRTFVDGGRYVEGELGMSIGGNTPEYANGTARFTNVTVSNNVLIEIGRSRPTNRTLSWGVSTSLPRPPPPCTCS